MEFISFDKIWLSGDWPMPNDVLRTTDFFMSSILNTFFEGTEELLFKVGIIMTITDQTMSASLILFDQESFL